MQIDMMNMIVKWSGQEWDIFPFAPPRAEEIKLLAYNGWRFYILDGKNICVQEEK